MSFNRILRTAVVKQSITASPKGIEQSFYRACMLIALTLRSVADWPSHLALELGVRDGFPAVPGRRANVSSAGTPNTASDRRPIAFVLSSLGFGGAERVALNLAAALHERGYEIDFLLMRAEGEFLLEAKRRFNVVDLDCSRTWKLPGRLAAYLIRARPIALVPSFWRLNLCACLARAVAPTTKLALWEHSPPSVTRNAPTWLYYLTASLFYRAATRIVAVSDGVRNDIRRHTFGLGRKTVTIYNAIALPPGLPAAASSKRIIWVGRFAEPKNPQLMLEAFAYLASSEGYTLDFVGDGPLRPDVEARAEELQVSDRVRFLGFQPDVYSCIMRANILVLSSDQEGLPTVIGEALNAGLRLVSTDCGEGVHEILENGKYGTIVPTNDPPAMAEAIARELATPGDPELQQQGAQRFKPCIVAGQFVAAIGLEAPLPES